MRVVAVENKKDTCVIGYLRKADMNSWGSLDGKSGRIVCMLEEELSEASRRTSNLHSGAALCKLST
jgi:hypothetical protein